MVHTHRVRILVVALACIAGCATSAQTSIGKRAKIVELMELTGSKAIGDQVGELFAQQLFAALQKTNPTMPQRAQEIIQEVTIETLREHSQELSDRIIPLYEKHFSESEIDELLTFYRTPTGRKMVKQMPVLLQEVIPIAQAWGQELTPVVETKLRERLTAEGLAR